MNLKELARFNKKVRRPTKRSTCWLWQGAKSSGGYGQIRIKRGDRWLVYYAHRASYEHYVGEIPEGLQIDHKCRKRNCVNPSHLEVVTNRENALRGNGFAAKNARKTHCPKKHPYEGNNLMITKAGSRVCRTCSNNKSRAYRLRKKSLSLRYDLRLPDSWNLTR